MKSLLPAFFFNFLFFILAGRAAEITASSTAYADVLAAISSAHTGDTVRLPKGTNTWTNSITIVTPIRIVGSGTNTCRILSNLSVVDGLPQAPFILQLTNDAPMRISGIWIKDVGRSSGIISSWSSVHPTQIRIDHCLFEGLQFGILIKGAFGVCDHCTFLNCGNSRVQGYWSRANFRGLSPPFAWNSVKYFFFEDCAFVLQNWTQNSYLMDTEMPANYIVRYCRANLNRAAAVVTDGFDMHGEFNDSQVSELAPQIYGNTFYVTGDLTASSVKFADMRGGANALIYSNTVIGTAASLVFRDNVYHLPLMTNTYAWANTGNGVPMIAYDADGVAQGVNYSLSRPAHFAAPPYPHPRVLAEDAHWSFDPTTGIVAYPFVTNADNTISQHDTTIDPIAGGRAAYRFSVTIGGIYQVSAMVSVSQVGGNSLFVNMDAEPTVAMAWRIPVTSGVMERTVGDGVQTRKWQLSAGDHQLIIRGGDADVKVGRIEIQWVSRPGDPTPRP